MLLLNKIIVLYICLKMRDLQKNIYDFTTLFVRVTTGFLMFYLHGLGKINLGLRKMGKTW